MTSILRDRITDDMKAAMRARESARLSTIRLLLAALKQKEIDERVVLSDADVLGIVKKLIKQRRESISQFLNAGRQDLADVETAELGLLQAYLPAQLAEDELQTQINIAVEEVAATSSRDMGKVMALLKSRLAGQADMARVSALIKARLSG